MLLYWLVGFNFYWYMVCTFYRLRSFISGNVSCTLKMCVLLHSVDFRFSGTPNMSVSLFWFLTTICIIFSFNHFCLKFFCLIFKKFLSISYVYEWAFQACLPCFQFCLYFFICFFLELFLQHMEVPSLGDKLELSLWPMPQSYQHGLQAASATYTAAHGNAGSLTH